jgi:hypothetical protein
VDVAVDAYFNDAPNIATTTSQASRGSDITTKLGKVFDQYKGAFVLVSGSLYIRVTHVAT